MVTSVAKTRNRKEDGMRGETTDHPSTEILSPCLSGTMLCWFSADFSGNFSALFSGVSLAKTFLLVILLSLDPGHLCY